ncbi:ankyrin [Dacryopinax primogenitus]|uniref:Ankyrin n=1 Tax=Dacryopinax primogenitus (strain DJM 731) TaxID=1858805 RepID=M5G8J3_DACPD|nr:ankyrin [Dacryopinax primogenitus]EJU06536.1 ankyrin [Dacryopinax primogenitus]
MNNARPRPIGDDDEDSDEEFVYPGGPQSETPSAAELPDEEDEDSDEEFVYPRPSEKHDPPATVSSPVEEPSTVLLECLAAAAASGDLTTLQKVCAAAYEDGKNENFSPFALANDAAPRTGLTALHAAASRGRLEIVRWRKLFIIEECGAMVDFEDKEGETALHKAALNGHFSVVIYLISNMKSPADAHAQDADGWTALHNACSKGYLDIVRWLCEQGGAADVVSDDDSRVRGVDRKSKGGWTPLMNAASKGHLPVVLYLVTKQAANPLIRNNWGETAYDAAAAVFEVWICEILQKAEAERWQGSSSPCDPIAVHTTIPLIIYENQRLDTRLKTLAVNGGRPKFSPSGLGKKGRRAPFELTVYPPDGAPERIPAWRSDVQLPLLDDPFNLKRVNAKGDAATPREGSERSFFWLSDWTLDLTHPKCDAIEGWQYARHLEDPDDQWTSETPNQLERLLSGSGAMTAGLIGPSTPRANGLDAAASVWCRRRRWVRVMRRRLDIPPLPYLEPDGIMYLLQPDGSLTPYLSEYDDAAGGSEGGQELGSMPQTFLSSAQDYVSRARYLAGSQHARSYGVEFDAYSLRTPIEEPVERSAADVRRSIGKLQRAVSELRTGMLNDDDAPRKAEADALLNRYSRELDRIRLQAGAERMFTVGEDDEQDDDDDDDESFHYPVRRSSPAPTQSTARPPSVHSHPASVDYFNLRASTSSSRTAANLTPDLSQAPEFRVPTHEAPQKVVTPRWTAPLPHSLQPTWEPDSDVIECRNCHRRFGFLLRKHHCRRCGHIFCDRCSSHRFPLYPADVVLDPGMAYPVLPEMMHRVCQSCYEELTATASIPGQLRGGLNGIVVDPERLAPPGTSRDSSSVISDLTECPVCGQNLADLGSPMDQEIHVKNCLEGNSSGGVQNSARYLVYRLPADSSLIGSECELLFTLSLIGSAVARLSCLCTFHNGCLSAWLQRGRACPVHARDT